MVVLQRTHKWSHKRPKSAGCQFAGGRFGLVFTGKDWWPRLASNQRPRDCEPLVDWYWPDVGRSTAAARR